MRGDVVIDGRNALDPDAVRAAGLRLRGRRAAARPAASRRTHRLTALG